MDLDKILSMVNSIEGASDHMQLWNKLLNLKIFTVAARDSLDAKDPHSFAPLRVLRVRQRQHWHDRNPLGVR